MKTILILSVISLTISCSPNYQKNFTVSKNDKNYRVWISYSSKEKDSIELNWLLSYKIENNSNRGVKFHRIRKRPFYTYQAAQMILNDSLVLFKRSIKENSIREINIYVSKIASSKDFPSYVMNKKNEINTYGDYHKNITKIPQEQIEFRKSTYFQKILKEIENDSIAIVFRDTVADDYFQFKGIIKDKELKFSR